MSGSAANANGAAVNGCASLKLGLVNIPAAPAAAKPRNSLRVRRSVIRPPSFHRSTGPPVHRSTVLSVNDGKIRPPRPDRTLVLFGHHPRHLCDVPEIVNHPR